MGQRDGKSGESRRGGCAQKARQTDGRVESGAKWGAETKGKESTRDVQDLRGGGGERKRQQSGDRQ